MVYINAINRLGNLMFEYAAALCCDGGVPCIMAGSDAISTQIMQKHKELFGEISIATPPEDATYWKEPCVPYVKIQTGPKHTIIEGVFFSEKYFDREIILKRYSPSKEQEAKLKSKYGNWLNCRNVTSIHVRRGDYMALQFNFPFAGRNYYRKALSIIPDCSDYIVFSDDIKWCKSFFCKNFKDKRFLFVDGNTPLQDIYLMSLCKNNIISNGSFAWWGAWLNKNPMKRVLAPSNWFGFAVDKKRVNPCDIYFEGTEIISNRYDYLDWLRAHLGFYWRLLKIKLNPTVRFVRKVARRVI